MTGLGALRTAAMLFPALLVAGSEAGADEERSGPTSLPLTFEQVWFRELKSASSKGKRMTGDLTVTGEALEMRSRKKAVVVALQDIRLLSLGVLPGDPDTEWAVLELADSATPRLVGVRDGRRLGFGPRTGAIHARLKEIFRDLGVAQYDVHDGYRTFDELDRQFTMAIPADWHATHLSLTEVDGRPIWGTVLLSAEPLGDATDSRRVLSERDVGVGVPSFFVDRREAGRGMRCDGLERARDDLLHWVAEDPLFAGGIETAGPPAVQATTLSGCAALRVETRGKAPDGTEVVVELRIFSDEETVFLVGMRGTAGERRIVAQAFERAVATFRLAVARPAPPRYVYSRGGAP